MPPKRTAPTHCTAPGCERARDAAGLCSMHRARMKRHGVLEPPKFDRKAHQARIYALKNGLCTVPACQKPLAPGRSICQMHRWRMRVHGSYSTPPGFDLHIHGAKATPAVEVRPPESDAAALYRAEKESARSRLSFRHAQLMAEAKDAWIRMTERDENRAKGGRPAKTASVFSCGAKGRKQA